MRGFTQETTTALLTTIDNTECMSESDKIPGNIASWWTMLRVLWAYTVRYRLVYLWLIKNGGTLHGFDKQSDPQLPSTITLHVSLFKEFTLLGIECSRMSNSVTAFSCWDWPSTIQFLDGTYWSCILQLPFLSYRQ